MGVSLSIAKPARYLSGKTMLKSLPCVKSNSRSSPIRIMEQSRSFSPDLSSIVSESLDKGLPVIPFAQPAIFSLDKIPEDQDGGKRKTRPGNKAQRPNLILEEETDTASPSGPPSRLTDPSYIEMSPSCPSFSLKSDDYVRMDHIYPGPSQPPQSESLPSGVLSPAQRRSSHIFGRLFKKGNRHKADYVFVDFERDNYMDMGRIQDKNWKFLTYFPKHKKLSC